MAKIIHIPPYYVVVAPREARDLGTGRKPRKLVVVTQWVRTDSSSPTWPKPRQQASSGLHVHTQQWAYAAGGNARREAGGGTPKKKIVGDTRIPLQVVRRGKPTVSTSRKAAVR